jgi:hypothetical protein
MGSRLSQKLCSRSHVPGDPAGRTPRTAGQCNTWLLPCPLEVSIDCAGCTALRMQSPGSGGLMQATCPAAQFQIRCMSEGNESLSARTLYLAGISIRYMQGRRQRWMISARRFSVHAASSLPSALGFSLPSDTASICLSGTPNKTKDLRTASARF